MFSINLKNRSVAAKEAYAKSLLSFHWGERIVASVALLIVIVVGAYMLLGKIGLRTPTDGVATTRDFIILFVEVLISLIILFHARFLKNKALNIFDELESNKK